MRDRYIFMFDNPPRTPQKDASKYSSYREKRAESRHISTYLFRQRRSISNTKALEEIEESLKTNLRRRGISQTFLEVQPVTRPFQGPFETLPTEEFSASRLIDRYSNTNRITEVAEDDIIQNNSAIHQITAKKPRPTAKTPLLNKNASFLEKSTPQQSVKNLLERNQKPELPKTHTSFIQERRTVVKGIKSTAAIASTTSIKPEKKIEKKGIGLYHGPTQTHQIQHTEPTSHSSISLTSQIPKVQALQQQLMRTMTGEKAAHLAFHFSSIIELLRTSDYV